MAPSRTARLAGALRRLGLPGLAFAAGSVDAATYLGLGHAFPANMTGNTVLLGVAVARGEGRDGLRSAVVLVAFVLGVTAGTILRGARADRDWPRNATLALVAEGVVLAGLLAGWLAASPPAGVARYVLLGAAGGAMGLQSAAAREASDQGVATTYMTGTLTNAVAGLTRRALAAWRHRPLAGDDGELAGAMWLVYGAGALVGALGEVGAGAAVLAIPTVLVAATAAAARARVGA